VEKKIYSSTLDVVFEEKILSKVNENIEKICINSNVLFLVDYFSYKTYYDDLNQIIKTSLNNINLKCIYNYDEKSIKDCLSILNESYCLIVAFGENELLNFAKSLTINNHTNYLFIVENFEKPSIFGNFCIKNNLFYNVLPPSIVLIDKQCNNKKQNFLLLSEMLFLNFFKLDGFLCDLFLHEKSEFYDYDESLSLTNNAILYGLFLQKNNLNYSLLDEILFHSKLKNSKRNKILLCYVLFSLYLGFIKKINYNNFNLVNYNSPFVYETKKQTYFLNNTGNFKTDKILFGLISLRNFLTQKLSTFKAYFNSLLNLLKTLNNDEFYKLSKINPVNKMLNGIKIVSKINKNAGFLRIIKDFGFLN